VSHRVDAHAGGLGELSDSEKFVAHVPIIGVLRWNEAGSQLPPWTCQTESPEFHEIREKRPISATGWTGRVTLPYGSTNQ
jgi:hypothetical protein